MSTSNSDRISSEEFQTLLDKMISLKIITQGKDSKDNSIIYTPTKSFEEHLAQMQGAFPDKEFTLKMAELTEKTGSIEVAWKTFMFIIVAQYLDLSVDETARRKPELVKYADILYRLGQYMRFRRDSK